MGDSNTRDLICDAGTTDERSILEHLLSHTSTTYPAQPLRRPGCAIRMEYKQCWSQSAKKKTPYLFPARRTGKINALAQLRDAFIPPNLHPTPHLLVPHSLQARSQNPKQKYTPATSRRISLPPQAAPLLSSLLERTRKTVFSCTITQISGCRTREASAHRQGVNTAITDKFMHILTGDWRAWNLRGGDIGVRQVAIW